MMLDPKALESATDAVEERLERGHATEADIACAAIRAYLSAITPAEVGGLWVPANPEHAKLGWSYDFEQTERIARAAYKNTGYDATMEVVEFVMAEADRRHRDALATERAAHAETKRERDEALKALEPFANIEPSTAVAHDGSEAEPYCVYLACRDRFDFTGADLAAARRVREGGKLDG